MHKITIYVKRNNQSNFTLADYLHKNNTRILGSYVTEVDGVLVTAINIKIKNKFSKLDWLNFLQKLEDSPDVLGYLAY